MREFGARVLVARTGGPVRHEATNRAELLDSLQLGLSKIWPMDRGQRGRIIGESVNPRRRRSRTIMGRLRTARLTHVA